MKLVPYFLIFFFVIDSVHITVCLIRHRRRHIQSAEDSGIGLASSDALVYSLIRDKGPVNTTVVRICGPRFYMGVDAACSRCIAIEGQERVSKRSVSLKRLKRDYSGPATECCSKGCSEENLIFMCCKS
ncbi:hypothetical protein FO519_006001 [Halicephalobus sp. NKZ332]|nr:hypothetical protein FO519_006001 [Halicephalobus sp. NKZ332]